MVIKVKEGSGENRNSKEDQSLHGDQIGLDHSIERAK